MKHLQDQWSTLQILTLPDDFKSVILAKSKIPMSASFFLVWIKPVILCILAWFSIIKCTHFQYHLCINKSTFHIIHILPMYKIIQLLNPIQINFQIQKGKVENWRFWQHYKQTNKTWGSHFSSDLLPFCPSGSPISFIPAFFLPSSLSLICAPRLQLYLLSFCFILIPPFGPVKMQSSLQYYLLPFPSHITLVWSTRQKEKVISPRSLRKLSWL